MAKQKAKRSNKQQILPVFGKFIKWFWRLFIGGWLLLGLVFLLASWEVFGELPTFEAIENPQSNLASTILTNDGVVLGKFFKGSENRTPVQYDDLPEGLVKALVATEDERYYNHAGIDARGTLRAVVKLGSDGGASTITQQLAKNLFTKKPSDNIFARIIQKAKEWVIATRLERQYTKEEILAMYLNTVDFLYRAVGIQSAARVYFDKEPKDLSLEESAVIVAMLKNPWQFNPYRERSKERSLRRRNQVFKQMEKNGFLTTAEKDSLQALPLKLIFTPQGHSDGMATYFRENLRAFVSEWAKNNPKRTEDGETGYYDIYTDGLIITTTIDSRMQAYAEDAVKRHMTKLQKEFDRQNLKNKIAPFRDITDEEIDRIITRAMKTSERWRKMKEEGKSTDTILKSFDIETDMRVFSWEGVIDTVMTPRDSIRYYKKFLRTGVMSMVPQTGEVRAWVGGNNLKHFQYDHVQKGKRQVGSTFKPFLYATAVDQLHKSPCDTLSNTLYCIAAGKHGNSKEWCPKNSSGNYGGMMTLKDALAQSVNTISARLMDQVGPKPVIEMVEKLGVDIENIPEVPSIALGTPDISLYEMVSAYATFANQGVYIKPQIVSIIADKNGTILYQHEPETRDVLSEEAAYVTIKLMEGVTDAGSGRRLRTKGAETYRTDYQRAVTGYPYEFKNPIAGKTGTTQNQSDGWFMGMVPNLVTGVWVGGDDRATHFPSLKYGQGATMALPIWGMYMKDCYANESLQISKEKFKKPEKLTIEVDCEKFNAKNEDLELIEELDY